MRGNAQLAAVDSARLSTYPPPPPLPPAPQASALADSDFEDDFAPSAAQQAQHAQQVAAGKPAAKQQSGKAKKEASAEPMEVDGGGAGAKKKGGWAGGKHAGEWVGCGGWVGGWRAGGWAGGLWDWLAAGRQQSRQHSPAAFLPPSLWSLQASPQDRPKRAAPAAPCPRRTGGAPAAKKAEAGGGQKKRKKGGEEAAAAAAGEGAAAAEEEAPAKPEGPKYGVVKVRAAEPGGWLQGGRWEPVRR